MLLLRSAATPSLSQMLKLHADVALHDFEMRLAGASRPFVSTSGARLSGVAAVSRQATAPPQTREVRTQEWLPACLSVNICQSLEGQLQS